MGTAGQLDVFSLCLVLLQNDDGTIWRLVVGKGEGGGTKEGKGGGYTAA